MTGRTAEGHGLSPVRVAPAARVRGRRRVRYDMAVIAGRIEALSRSPVVTRAEREWMLATAKSVRDIVDSMGGG